MRSTTNKIIDQDVLSYLKVDTRELIRYDNVLDFITVGLGIGDYLRTRLAFLLLDVHGEICWHCSDKKLVPNIHEMTLGQFRDKFVLMHNGECPVCHRTTLDLIREHLWTVPEKACWLLGQRSGKDWVLAYAALYAEYRLLVLERDHVRLTPTEYFDIACEGPLSCTVAGSKLNVDATISCMDILRTNSTWFQHYFEIMDMYGEKAGTPLYENTKHFVRYHNNVIVYGEVLGDVGHVRGNTRFFTVCPELAWCQNNDGNYMDVSQHIESIKNGMKTVQIKSKESTVRFNHSPYPLLLVATSPRSKADIAHVLETEALFDRRTHFTRNAIWEVSPDVTQTQIMGPEHPGGTYAQKMRDFACVIV